MKKLVEFSSDGDESILVEVEIPEDEEGDEEATRDGEVKKASKSFKKALAAVKPIAETLIEKCTGLSKRPQEIEVEFGIKMNAEAGVVVATTGVEANFKVTLKWKQAQE